MGTISDKLMRIINTKEDIRQALISKGYDVPTSIPFKEYAKMILDLPCNADSFPDIEGIVARYSALGLTNEQMTENPVWKDLTGNGHDLQMKNFSWGGMSGVGGYKYNFLSNDWSVDVNQSSVVLSHKIVIINKRTSIQLVKLIRNELENTINITLKITGLEANGSSFKIYDNVGSSHAQEYNKDGIYQINYTATEGANGIYFYVPGGNMGQLENPITIEQLPLYPGALVFDGVDDYGTCDNFPILTKEKGYTVVALRQWISMGEGVFGLVSNVKNWFNDGAFVLEYNSNNATKEFVNRPVSFGNINIEMDLPNNFIYQTSKSYKGVPITTGSFKGTNSLFVGKLNNIIGNCSNVAIWELVFLDHDATEEELTKIKDYFVKTYPWLFPDQAWTVTGKTNEDEDRATIANITGNGNDLILSNFGFAEGSGYNEQGEYAGYLVTDGVDDKIVSSVFGMGKDFTIVGDWKLINTGKNDNAGIVKFDSIVIYNYNPILINIKNGRNNLIPDQNTVNAICSDGRIYSKDWKESIYNEETESTSKNLLTIGYSGNIYTKIAFKNLAIYPTVLSKEDCIKAYNYLQTLK